MTARTDVYFVSDVHLGLEVNDAAGREERFVTFLRSLPVDSARALYLLGDIWDFWYEYRDVVPRTGVRVVAALLDLIRSGVEVFFFPGNHDIWCYSYFESIGMKKLEQPYFVDIDGKKFCLGHGDGLGGASFGYGLLQSIFRCRPLQRLFSTVHPTLAFRLGEGWSRRNRGRHIGYVFDKSTSYLYKFAEDTLREREVDFFVFGHLHCGADEKMEGGARFVVLQDWIDGGTPYARFNGRTFELRSRD